MNTIKRITGLTAAAAMLLSAGALPANAAYVYTAYTEVENGAVAVHRDADIFGFIAITDGTELETFKDGRYRPIEAVMEIAIDDESLPLWEFTMVVDSPTIIQWSETASALFASYGPDARYYKVELYDASSDYRDRFSEISRNYMLENEGVLDVVAYSLHMDALAEWAGDIELIYSSKTPYEVLEEDTKRIHSIDIEAHEQYNTWQQMLSDWQTVTDISGMSGSEIAASRAAAGIPSDYEMLDYAYGIAKQIREINPDYIIRSEPTLHLLSGAMVYTGASVWDGIGDVDGNGDIDASDAAAILSEAAMNGIGNSGTFTSEQAAAADVNADGQVDSSDAALILVYCAQKGTGTVASIKDIVMQ